MQPINNKAKTKLQLVFGGTNNNLLIKKVQL